VLQAHGARAGDEDAAGVVPGQERERGQGLLGLRAVLIGMAVGRSASSRSALPGPRSMSEGSGSPRSALVSNVPEKAVTSFSASMASTSWGDLSGRSTAPAWEVIVTVPATSATTAPAGSQRCQVLRAMGVSSGNVPVSTVRLPSDTGQA